MQFIYQLWVLKIFSPNSVASLFSFLTVSFTEQKFKILMMYFLAIFSFVDYAFSIVSKNSSPNPGSSRFSPILLSIIYSFAYYI